MWRFGARNLRVILVRIAQHEAHCQESCSELESQKSRIGDWCVGLMNHACYKEKQSYLSAAYLSATPLSIYRFIALSATLMTTRPLWKYHELAYCKAKKNSQPERARRGHQGRPLSFSAFRKTTLRHTRAHCSAFRVRI